MLNVGIVVIALAVGAWLAFSKTLARSSAWKATVTPLASIMGSGFLVSAPLLGGAVGSFSLVCMASLLLIAYGVGGAIRFNIRYFEPIENERHGPVQSVAFLSRVVLAVAYFISTTYYLQLLAAFLLNAIGQQNELAAHAITTSLLLMITGIGMWRGLGMLEGVEKYAVAFNLGMIAALLGALAIYNGGLVLGGQWRLPDVSSTVDLRDLRVLLGLLIVVQGFETSRYLGGEHPAEQRIATMKWAQWISASIYLVFISLCTVLFQQDMGSDVTAIISMTAPVAAILPALLSVAAIGSQFSAAVADTEGCGGLIGELSHGKLPARFAYLLIMLVTVFITWETDVNEIIAYASRAFALYYTMQCLVACMVARNATSTPGRRWRVAGFGGLAVTCFCVFAFGLPAD